MFSAPTTLSDLLAAERRAIQRGETRGPPSAKPPSLEELKLLHGSLVAATKKDDDNGRFLKHSRAHHPHLDRGHGTAVRVSQEAAQRQREQQTVAQVEADPTAPAEAAPRSGVAISGREHLPGPQPVASLRSSGAVTYESQGHRVPPSGFRQALARCYASGGRLSAASIPSSGSTQQALATMRKIARTGVEPDFQMLVPDQYHRATSLMRANRAIEAEEVSSRA